MRIPDAEPVRRDSENVLPLVNIVFLLLIFFMLAGTLSKPEPFKLSPPQAAVEATITPGEMQLQLSKDGIFGAENEVLTQVQLLEKLSEGKVTTVQLKADASLPSKRLMHVIRLLSSSGVVDLQIVTEKTS